MTTRTFPLFRLTQRIKHTAAWRTIGEPTEFFVSSAIAVLPFLLLITLASSCLPSAGYSQQPGVKFVDLNGLPHTVADGAALVDLDFEWAWGLQAVVWGLVDEKTEIVAELDDPSDGVVTLSIPVVERTSAANTDACWWGYSALFVHLLADDGYLVDSDGTSIRHQIDWAEVQGRPGLMLEPPNCITDTGDTGLGGDSEG